MFSILLLCYLLCFLDDQKKFVSEKENEGEEEVEEVEEVEEEEEEDSPDEDIPPPRFNYNHLQ